MKNKLIALALLASAWVSPLAAQSTTAPADIVADTVPGEKVVLEVTADGTTPMTFQWEKQDLAGGVASPFVPLEGQTAARLTLDKMSPTLAGVYRARVTNVAGFALSPTATVRIATPPTVKSFTITVTKE